MWVISVQRSSAYILLLLVFQSSYHANADLTGNFIQPGYYEGPENCLAVIAKFAHLFSEYPDSHRTKLNFLILLDPCNHNAEEEFMRELSTYYFSQRKNGEELFAIMAGLKKIWENWRSHSVWGSAEGNRICNPSRLLSCHESLHQCVCRQQFKYGVDAKRNAYYSRIQTVEVEIPDHYKGLESWEQERVHVCKVKTNGVCDWEVPWLGVCSLPCAGSNWTCVGQPQKETRGKKLCRYCYAQEGLLTEGCVKGENVDAGVSRLYSFKKLGLFFVVLICLFIA